MAYRNPEIIKTDEQVAKIRAAGHILGKILAELESLSQPDVDIWQLEEAFLDLCATYKVRPACKGYSQAGLTPFPTGLCVSLNNQSVHCFPKKDIKLKESDLINIDTVVELDGWNADSSFAKAMPLSPDTAKKIVETSKLALAAAISKAGPEQRIGVISEKIYKAARQSGFNVLTDYAGHGIGREMHEWPEVPCYGSKNDGPKLKPNMIICIESLLCQGQSEVKSTGGWETQMADGGFFAQFEHTVLITPTGYEILTLGDTSSSVDKQ